MLVIEDRPYFDSVVAHAKSVGLYEGDQSGCLKDRLDYLRNYRDPVTTRTRLFRDFAPYSFSFVIEVKRDEDWRLLFNGGLIFHGAHDGCGSGAAPTYAVTLTPTSGWAIHT
jgi:hypothetical protein